VCKDCARLPKENRDAIEQKEEIFSDMSQSHISEKNTLRLKRLAASSHRDVAELAAIGSMGTCARDAPRWNRHTWMRIGC
jgi:hypothetical protein